MKRFISIILLLVLLTGCSGKLYTSSKKIEVKLYYGNLNNSNIQWVTRPIEYMNSHEKYLNTLKALINGPYSSDTIRSIDVKTQILSVNLKNKVLSVDLSKDFINLNDDLTKLISIMTVTNTMLQFKEISGIKLSIEGKKLISPKGKPYGILKEYDLNETKKIMAVIYLPDLKSNKLIETKKEITLKDGEIIGEKILRLLLEDKAMTALENVKVNKYVEDKGILNIDFSSDFYKIKELNEFQKKLTLYSIVNTLTELENISNINISVEGKRFDYLIKDENINKTDN